MEKIKVVIVEDDINFLKAMTTFINRQQDMLIVGTATTKSTAIEIAKGVQFDVILMDINLNENMCDGILATVEILQFSSSKIIMLTSLKQNEIVLDSFTAGAVNYISKEKYRDIPPAIRASYYNDSPIEVLLNKFSELQRQEQLKDLTNTEKEVFELLEQGYSKNMIETEMYKSQNTVKTQVKKILRKLGVRSSREAVDKVRTMGLREKLRDGLE
ncbi:MAG: response regulator transcription factor [Ruminiclostridium sp.]